MLNKILLVLVLAGLLLCGAAAASAQEFKPTVAAACAPETPCADPLAAATTLGSLEFNAVATATEPVTSGFGLAWVIMALLVAALLYALLAAVLAAVGRQAPVLPDAVAVLIPIVSVIGLGVALYMTYIESTNTAAVCGPVGDCNAVQSSPFAKLFGVVPVGLLGALGYLAILAAWIVARLRDGAFARLAWLAIFGMALFGVIFSIYLTYLELFIIKAVCIWCLSSAFLMAAALALAVGPAVAALVPEEAQ